MRSAGTAFDVVVSDYLMAGRNGVDVLRAARELQPRAVRVLLTSNPPADIGDVIASGVVHRCLLKPFQEIEKTLEALAPAAIDELDP